MVLPNYRIMKKAFIISVVCLFVGGGDDKNVCVVQGPARDSRGHTVSLTVVSPPSSTFELDLADGGNSTRAQRGLSLPPLLPHPS